MFPSSNYTSGSYPRFPSSSSSSSQYPSFSFLHPENSSASNTFLHDPLAVTYIPSHYHTPIPETLANWAVADCAAMLNQDLSGGALYGIAKKPVKKTTKKDRHSKIHTSQGLRDRRVRLSIEIARKFFDLQDMLGFDKASNTLDWLFTKSKKAIKELTLSKQSADSFSSSSEGEVVSMIHQDLRQQQRRVDLEERMLKEPAYCVKAKMKESREKARARARERTSSKMCNISGEGKVQELKKKCPATENHPQILNQLRTPSPLQPHSQDMGGEVPRDDEFNVIEESIVIKRKLKHALMSSIHQNVVIPKEASVSNSDYNSFPNLCPNLEANNASTGRPTFCAIASMNLSTGLHIFGKSWEEYTNPHPT